MLGSSFEEFPLEVIDDQFQVQAEKNPQVFYDYLEEQELPIAPFKIGGTALAKDTDMHQIYFQRFCRDVMEDQPFTLWQGLNRIIRGNLKEGITDLSETLGFKKEFLLLNLIAFLKEDENLGRHCIKRTVDQIEQHMRQEFNWDLEPKALAQTKSHLLALFTISRGYKFDIVALSKEVSPNIDLEMALALYSVSK